jgi:hypothetical protein
VPAGLDAGGSALAAGAGVRFGGAAADHCGGWVPAVREGARLEDGPVLLECGRGRRTCHVAGGVKPGARLAFRRHARPVAGIHVSDQRHSVGEAAGEDADGGGKRSRVRP